MEPGAPDAESLVDGLVVRTTGSWYDVASGGDVIPCKVRGRFRLEGGDETNPVVIGDRVRLRKGADGTGLIVQLHERSTVLVRRAAGRRVGVSHVIAANVDAAWVMQSVDLPRFNPGFVDRFLVMAGVHRIPAGIVINKSDLLDRRTGPPIRLWSDLYRGLGYPVLLTSARTGDGVGDLREALAGRISAVAGPSGVGKSTLLNAVDPGLGLRTGEVSSRTGKGTHTTTSASLHALEGGGYVADTPGLREFGLVELDPPHLSHYFTEMAPVLTACRYPNCTHDHEPGCAVIEAVDDGRISHERYASYLGMLRSLRLGEKDVGR